MSTLQATKIRNFRKPGKIKSICLDSEDINESSIYELREKLGIDVTDVLINPLTTNSQYLNYAMDADPTPPITTPSIGTPVQFLQSWLPGNVRIVTAPREADDIVGIATIGRWEDEEVIQTLVGNAGTPTTYADNANFPTANVNANFVKRTIVRFELGMVVGRLESERLARVRINSPEEKRYGVMEGLEITRNQVAFFGFNTTIVGTSSLTFGILNEPNLGAYLTLPFGNWATATATQIYGDVNFLAANLQNQSNGRVDPQRLSLTLVVSTQVEQYLKKVNEFNVTAYKSIQDNYPNMRIISCPQFTAAVGGEDAIYLFADEVPRSGTDDDRTWLQAVPTQMRTLGVEQRAKGYAEDYSNATAGVMLKRPFAVVRATGT